MNPETPNPFVEPSPSVRTLLILHIEDYAAAVRRHRNLMSELQAAEADRRSTAAAIVETLERHPKWYGELPRRRRKADGFELTPTCCAYSPSGVESVGRRATVRLTMSICGESSDGWWDVEVSDDVIIPAKRRARRRVLPRAYPAERRRARKLDKRLAWRYGDE